jgi:hypothetical protein
MPPVGGLNRDTLDPVLDFTVPADGEYVLRIEDDRGNGGPDFVYRVEIRTRDGCGADVHTARAREPVHAAGSPSDQRASRGSLQHVRVDFQHESTVRGRTGIGRDWVAGRGDDAGPADHRVDAASAVVFEVVARYASRKAS